MNIYGLASMIASDTEQVELYLRQGWEPFAVSSDMNGERIWMKRIVNEIHHEQDGANEGTSRRASRKTKAKDSH